jgi:hypothetical protein
MTGRDYQGQVTQRRSIPTILKYHKQRLELDFGASSMPSVSVSNVLSDK